MAAESNLRVYFRLLSKIVLLEFITVLLTIGYCWFKESLSMHVFALTLTYAGLIVLCLGGVSLMGSRTGGGIGGGPTSVPAGAVSRTTINQDEKDKPSHYRFAAVFVPAGLIAIAISEVMVRMIVIG